MNLEFLYTATSSLSLDEAYDVPDVFPHGRHLPLGRIKSLHPKGLTALIEECRMPARSFRAHLYDTSQVPVGVISTGTGMAVGELLVDLCRALAEGFAIFDSSAASVTVLEPSLRARVVRATTNGLLDFSPAAQKPNAGPGLIH